MFRLTLRRLAFLAGLSLAAASAPAAGQTQGRVPVDQATTSQKAVFVENLVTRSVAASRIETSGDAAAMASLDQARALVAAARRDLAANDAAAADVKLGQALRLVNDEVRRLSGAQVKGDSRKRAYERRLHAVRVFLSAYQRVADDDANRLVAGNAAAMRALIAEAETAAAAGRIDAAIVTLDRAYAVARGDIREMREGKTLVRTLNFETAQEEYDYELGRNRSYFVLLQYALGDKRPMGSVVGRINEHRVMAQKLRAQAEAKAARGDHADAIGLLNDATGRLLKAIRMSGLFVPG